MSAATRRAGGPAKNLGRIEDLVVEAEATIPTRHGEFRFIVFRHAEDFAKEHVAIVAATASGDGVPVRVHSECSTSSLKCDCAGQLGQALGVDVLRRVPVLVPAQPLSHGYLAAKRTRMRQFLPQLVRDSREDM